MSRKMGFLIYMKSIAYPSSFLWIQLLLSSVCANGRISAILAFGDSVLDTGNNNNLNTLTKCNFPPYGRDFPRGLPTGRFSDGKVFSDLIEEGLGIKGTLPAYLDHNLRSTDLSTGVCFASGGSGLDPTTSSIQSVLSTKDQLNLFKEYKSRLEIQVGKEKSNTIISKALFIVSLGNNDIAVTYYTTHLKPQHNISSYTSQLVTWSSNFVKEIYGLGARKIGYLSTLPLGCLPAALVGGSVCNEIVNEASQMFNSKLSIKLNALKNTLPEANIFYIDLYSPLLDLVHNPQKSGFEIGNVGCCCVGTISCPMPWIYVFWDSAHPTERAYRIIVNQTLDKYANNFS